MSDTVNVQVAERIEEADGVVSLVLVDALGHELPQWRPGAHLDLHLDRRGEAGLVRQYSLCGDPAERSSYRVAVLREETGTASRQIHDVIRQGQLLRVSAPRDRFGYAASPSLVFIAGGIGITPLLSMLEAASAEGTDWQLHYAGRSRRAMAFLERLQRHGDRVHVYPGDTGARMDLDAIVRSSGAAPIYACGPARLLEAIEERAAESGRLRVERFVSDAQAQREDDHPFEVEFALTGGSVMVRPGESILDKVVEAGVPAPSSCRGGTCGTCETFVVEGEPDHRDAVLNAKEREESEVMMICVSRCKGARLVLEL